MPAWVCTVKVPGSPGSVGGAATSGAGASELGWLIRRAPEQWHVLQSNWPAAA